MGLFDALFGNKKKTNTEGIDISAVKEEIKREIREDIIRENDILRHDLATELHKIHQIIEIKTEDQNIDDKLEKVNKSISDIVRRLDDLVITGKLALDNRDRITKIANKMTTKEELEAYRNEILNMIPERVAVKAQEIEREIENEPRKPLRHILEELPNSRRALVNLLMDAENPLTYKQIASIMGLTYNTVKVYIRDVREAGFPIEEYMTNNKKLLNIPNSVKAALLYND